MAGPRSEGDRWRIPLGVLLLALAARLVLLWVGETYTFDPAENYREAGYETGQIAYHLAEGDGFVMDTSPFGDQTPAPTAWLAPLYPLVVGGIFALFGSFTPTSLILILVLQAAFGAMTAAGLALLGRAAGAPVAGALAGVGLALWPTAVARDVRVIWGTTLFIFLAVLLVLLVLRLERKGGTGLAVGTGLVAGLLLLTEPAGALFVLALVAWLAWRKRRARLGEAAVAIATAVILLIPWTVRNYALFDRVVPLKSNFGQELFIGNHPGSEGRYRPLHTLLPLLSPDAREQALRADEVERAALLGRQAVAHITQNPGQFLEVTLRRVLLFWRLPSYGVWTRVGIGGRLGRAAGLAYDAAHLAIVFLAGLGAVLAFRRRDGLTAAILFLLVYPLPYYVTHVTIGRYRSPVFAFLLLLAAYAVVRTWRATKDLIPSPSSRTRSSD